MGSVFTVVNHIAGLNMKVCLAMGVAQLLIWAIWAGVTRHPSRWKLWLVVVGEGLAMLLQIYDFPPYRGFVDAHALYHAANIPLTYLWWSFIRDDSEFRTTALLKKPKWNFFNQYMHQSFPADCTMLASYSTSECILLSPDFYIFQTAQPGRSCCFKIFVFHGTSFPVVYEIRSCNRNQILRSSCWHFSPTQLVSSVGGSHTKLKYLNFAVNSLLFSISTVVRCFLSCSR